MQAMTLACGVILMMGWFTFATMMMSHAGIIPMGMDAEAADGDAVRPGVPVLMYHHILPQSEINGMFADNNVVVSLEQFESDIQTLKQQGYQTIGLRQLNDYVRNGADVPEKSVVITFDDGYLSNKIYAMPVLEAADYTAVIFALTGWIEEHPQLFNVKGLQYLSWPEIKEMGHVFQFASHTDNLHLLAWNGQGKLTAVSQHELREDLQRSVKKLQGTSYFSYPYGHYNQTSRQLLEQEGIDLAFTVNPSSVHMGDDRFTLGRWDMYQYSIEEVLQNS